MNMQKTARKIFAGTAAGILLSTALSAVPAGAASSNEKTFGDFTYTPYSTYAEIHAYNGSDAVVEVPSEIDGLTVTTIGESGLCKNDFIETLILPETITTIGEYAISNNKNLKEIVFPASLTTIAFGAIGYNNSLTEVVFPEGLETIGEYVLYTCYELTDVSIPSTVSSIGKSFASCCYKTKGFSVEDANAYYCDADGVLYSKDMSVLVRYPSDLPAAEYSVPDTVTEIAPYAFMTVNHLETVHLPDSVTTLGEGAFEMCAALKRLKLPHELQEIPLYCLTSLYHLEELYIPKTVTEISKYACVFYDTIPTIYYEGTEEEWAAISIGSGNTGFDTAAILYQYDYNSGFLPPEEIFGDVNADGIFNTADAVLLQQWLLHVPGAELADWETADRNADGQLNGFDLCQMKQELLICW